MQVAFKKLYDAEGNSTSVFDSWFKRDSDGKISQTFELVDPDSSDFRGSELSRKTLRLYLETMWKIRKPNSTETDIENAKITKEYY